VSSLSFLKKKIFAADLGEENLMPDIKNVRYIHSGFIIDEKIPKKEAQGIGKGMINTLLPYTLQDNYNRDRKWREFDVAVLENEKLKATFILDLGGRLWSLYDKVNDRELLYKNTVFQPGNLALRNAWFSGGIEWNVGIKGHNPLTCSPLFACDMKTSDGESFLRMYEYERIRDITYCLDFFLPDDSSVLYVNVTIENTSEKEKYMYWWSNIAVPEYEGGRVIAPCKEAILTFYTENKYRLSVTDIPYMNETDISYPKNSPAAKDYFYIVPENENKWVSNVDKDGNGLLEFSTNNLFGKKLFVWGQGKGGRNWNRWLSDSGEPYVEIQAGLARTQYEHFIMEPNSKITFTEGYTAISVDKAKAHGEFNAAVEEVGRFCKEKANGIESVAKKSHNATLVEIKHFGSGFGYLENLAREKQGKKAISETLVFPSESVTEKEAPWEELLKSGDYPFDELKTPLKSFQGGKVWLDLLQNQANGDKANAASLLQLGITEYANGNIDAAYKAFENSNECLPNAWALRNLAMIEKNEKGNSQKAFEYISLALEYNITYRGLLIGAADIMLAANKESEWLETFDKLDEKLKADGRLRLYKAIAHIRLEELDEAAKIIDKDFVLPDIEEGELSVSYVWEDLYRKIVSKKTGITDIEELKKLQNAEYPLPDYLDFRMQ